MKKLFIAVMAVAALASCAQEEIILNNNKAIEFGDAFVNNATKVIYEDGEEVTAFKVWGTVEGTSGTPVALYEGANVTRGDKAYNEPWTCDVTRFWTPDCDYNFYAVVDATTVNAANGVPTSIEYTADGVTDLLYDTQSKTTKTGLDVPTGGSLVKFTMQHLLSRIQFTFTNGVNLGADDKAAYSFNVTSLKVSGLWKEGEYTITPANWARTGETTMDITFTTFEIGQPSEGYVIIPGAQNLTISYGYEVYFDNDTTDEVAAKKIYATTTPVEKSLSHTFEKGTAYNIAASLKLDNEIEFTIETVNGFAPAGGDVTIQ